MKHIKQYESEVEEFELGDYVKYKPNAKLGEYTADETDNIYKITKINNNPNIQTCVMVNIIYHNDVWEQLKYLRKLTDFELDLIKYNV